MFQMENHPDGAYASDPTFCSDISEQSDNQLNLQTRSSIFSKMEESVVRLNTLTAMNQKPNPNQLTITSNQRYHQTNKYPKKQNQSTQKAKGQLQETQKRNHRIKFKGLTFWRKVSPH